MTTRIAASAWNVFKERSIIVDGHGLMWLLEALDNLSSKASCAMLAEVVTNLGEDIDNNSAHCETKTC